MKFKMANQSLYLINTRVVLQELREQVGHSVTPADWPADYLDTIQNLGFDWVWLLGVWQTSPLGKEISQSNPAWQEGFRRDLPDLKPGDITGSPYAISGYSVHEDFGGDEALKILRERLARRGIRLMLDFVPNHVALDHPWIHSHPEYFIHGDEASLAREPGNYVRRDTGNGSVVLAHGRDPYFPGWVDTLQLNYRHPGLRAAQNQQLKEIAQLCDGVRCDMSMLLLPEIIRKTWGPMSDPVDGSEPVDCSFWPEAINRIKSLYPDFVFLAEVYWDLEWKLQQEGFDFTYDKRLYDRIHAGNAGQVRDHLRGDQGYQSHLARFLENHDEERATSCFPEANHMAGAVVSFTVPGLRLFHEGQLEGRHKRVSVHLGRRAKEPVDPVLQPFYHHLLLALKLPQLREGKWEFRESLPAWFGNPTHENILAWTWEMEGSQPCLIAVNFSSSQSQCYVRLPFPLIRDRAILLVDTLGESRYLRDGNDLMQKGLYLDLKPWQYHLFQLEDLAPGMSENQTVRMIHL